MDEEPIAVVTGSLVIVVAGVEISSTGASGDEVIVAGAKECGLSIGRLAIDDTRRGTTIVVGVATPEVVIVLVVEVNVAEVVLVAVKSNV